MKINFLLLAIITATIMSCSTSYKTGQTPDDVYYSPARLQTDNVRREDENKNVQDNSVYTSPDDRYIRRRVHNRRYRRYDDVYNNPYGYNAYPPVYVNPKSGTPPVTNTSKPRTTNLGAYKPNTTIPDSLRSTNPKLGMQNNSGATTNGTPNPVRTFGNPANSSVPNNGSAVGNLIRRVFSGDNNSNNNNYNNGNYNNSNSNNSSSTRSFDRSSNNSNNSNSNTETKSAPTTNSTSAPVRTFKKDN